MDGYRIMAESYKKAVEQGKLTEKEARPYIKVFELLGELTQEDLYTMVDTTAFNEIIKAYCRRALREASVDKNIEEDVLTQLKLLFLKVILLPYKIALLLKIYISRSRNIGK